MGNNDPELQENEVSGACAPELANSLFEAIKSRYCFEDEILSASWQGTCCDGQYYVAKAFQQTLNQHLNHDDTFYDVIWDPPHWLDKCIDDVFKGIILMVIINGVLNIL